MNNFSRKISEIIKSKKLAVYSIAKNCNIERTYLSRVLSGERTLQYDKLDALLRFLDLSPSEEDTLRKIYVADFFGNERYEKYIDFINKISQLDSPDEVPSLNPSIKISLDLGSDFLSFNGLLDTANVVDFAVGNEFSKTGINTRLYTNLPSKHIFPVIRKYIDTIPDTMDFKHMISINQNDEFALDAIFDIVRFLKYGCFTMYHNSGSSNLCTPDTLFPYYVITNELCIFINGNFDSCHIVNNKALADIQAHEFLRKSKNAKKYITIYDDILSCKESCQQIHSVGYDRMYSFGTFCATLYMTADMWEQIARDEIPSRDYLVKSTYEYYSNFAEIYKDKYHIYLKDSIDDFINYGIVKNIPLEYTHPLTPENRLRVLENFKKRLLKTKQRFLLVKDPRIENLKDVSIEVFEKSDNEKIKFLSFYSMTEAAPMRYLGNINCNIDEPKTIEEFLQFTKYFSVSGACYTYEESMAILDDAIERCRAMK